MIPRDDKKRRTVATLAILLTILCASEVRSQTVATTGFNGTTTGCPAWDTSTQYLTGPPYYVTTVPIPSVSLFYSFVTNTFNFVVNSTYVPEWSRYVLAFSSFQSGMQSTSSLSKPGTCDNNDGSFASANFSNWWGHLPNAAGLGNLPANSKTIYPSNDHNGPLWTMTGNGCTRQVHIANFSYAQLSGCKDYAGKTLLNVNQRQSGSSLNGTFYVNLVAPANLANGEGPGGYMVQTWAYNFQINFQSNIVTIGNSQSNAGSYECVVMGVGVDGNGVLNIMVNCNYASAAQSGYPYGYFNTTRVSSSVGVNMTQTNTSTTIPVILPMAQTFTFQSTTAPPGGNYTGTYTAIWTIYGCTGITVASCGVSNLISLNVYVNALVNNQVTNNVPLTGTLSLFPNSTYLAVIPQTVPLAVGSTLCVKDLLGGIDAASLAQFTLTLNYVALCYNASNTVAVPVYDGVTQFGCMNSSNVAVLMTGNSAVSNAITQDYYNFAVVRNVNNLYTGFCFTVRQALLDTTNQVLYPGPANSQYVQVAMTATLGNQKRSVNQMYGGLGGVQRYSVANDDDSGSGSTEEPTDPPPTSPPATTRAPCSGAGCHPPPPGEDSDGYPPVPTKQPLSPHRPGRSVVIGLAVGLGVGLPLVFCCVIGALCFYKKKKKRRQQTRRDDYDTTDIDMLPASEYSASRRLPYDGNQPKW